jgi:hypothetical protein
MGSNCFDDPGLKARSPRENSTKTYVKTRHVICAADCKGACQHLFSSWSLITWPRNLSFFGKCRPVTRSSPVTGDIRTPAQNKVPYHHGCRTCAKRAAAREQPVEQWVKHEFDRTRCVTCARQVWTQASTVMRRSMTWGLRLCCTSFGTGQVFGQDGTGRRNMRWCYLLFFSLIFIPCYEYSLTQGQVLRGCDAVKIMQLVFIIPWYTQELPIAVHIILLNARGFFFLLWLKSHTL